MAGTLSPQIFTVLDNAGLIVSGAKIYCYATGTTTKQNTYTSAALSVANANPVIADSAGRATIFLDPAANNYDIVVAPSNAADPPLSNYYTLTNVSAVPSDEETLGDITVTAGENITTGDWVYLSVGDGGRTIGRWYKTDADLNYASYFAVGLGVATADIASGSTGLIRIQGTYSGASGMVAGSQYYLSATPGALTSSAPIAPAFPRIVAIATSTTSYNITYAQEFGNCIGTGSLVRATSATLTSATLVTPALGTPASGTLTNCVGLPMSSGLNAPFLFVPGTAVGSASQAKISGTIYVNTTSANSTNAGAQTLRTFTMPANTLAVDGNAVRITAFGSWDAGTTGQLVSITFGATSVTGITNAVGESFWSLQATVIRTGATAQIATGVSVSGAGAPANSVASFYSPAETLSGTVDVKCTCTSTSTAAVVFKGMIVEVLN